MNTLFESNKTIIHSEKKRTAIENGYDKNYCFKIIEKEEYLWDMRFWNKLKEKYTIQEVIDHIKKWAQDIDKGIISSNCGHCLYCMRLLLNLKWATEQEIAEAVIKNNKIKYAK